MTGAIPGCLGALAVVSLVSCGVREAPDPFRGAREGPVGPGVTVHTVRFQVSCDTCSVRWSVDEQTGALVERALWSHRVEVRLRPGETVQADVSALPSAGAGDVRFVRIYVDGDLATEAGPTDDAPAGGRGSVGATTMVPLPDPGGG